MNSRPRFQDSGDEDDDTNHDRTLRALEGRSDDDALRSAPVSSSRRGAFDNEDTGDVFLKIAREETSQRQKDEQTSDDNRSVVVSAALFSLHSLLLGYCQAALSCALCVCALIARVSRNHDKFNLRSFVVSWKHIRNTICFLVQC